MKKVNSKKNTNLIHHFVVPLLQQRRLTSSTTSWSPFSNREGKAGNRRGFTIVELVVAMVIIVLVSGAGISLVMTQTKVDNQATQTIDATNVCENAIECFRYAVNVSESDDENEIKTKFYDAFVLTGALNVEDYPREDDEGNVKIYESYKINTSGAKISIAISGKTITINAVDSFGVTIFDDSYTK